MNPALSPLCPSGEDVELLSAMAALGRFAPLLSGAIDPRYMRPHVRAVAEYLREHSRRDPGAWPPSLAALKDTWPDIHWNMRMADVPGLILQKYLDAFYRQARHFESNDVAAMVLDLGDPRMDADRRAALLMHAQQGLLRLSAIGVARNRGYTFGEDMNNTMSEVLGLTYSAQVRVRTPWDEVNDAVLNWEPGLYAMFSKTKQGKTHLLLCIAAHVALKLGLVTLYVDMENSKVSLNRRLASAHLGLSLESVSALSRRINIIQAGASSAEESAALSTRLVTHLSPEEQRLMGRLTRGIRTISEGNKGRLHIMDQSSLATGETMSVEAIIARAEAVGAELILVDQVHKYHGAGTTEKTKQATRVHKTAEYLHSEAIRHNMVIFTNTQQTRGKGKDRAHRDFELDHADEEMVFGSSAIPHNCVYLWHLQTLEVAEGVPYVDPLGVHRVARHLQAITPILARNGGAAGVEKRIWRLADNYAFDQVLDPEIGNRMAQDEFAARRKKHGYGKREDAPRKGAAPPSPIDFFARGGRGGGSGDA